MEHRSAAELGRTLGLMGTAAQSAQAWIDADDARREALALNVSYMGFSAEAAAAAIAATDAAGMDAAASWILGGGAAAATATVGGVVEGWAYTGQWRTDAANGTAYAEFRRLVTAADGEFNDLAFAVCRDTASAPHSAAACTEAAYDGVATRLAYATPTVTAMGVATGCAGEALCAGTLCGSCSLGRAVTLGDSTVVLMGSALAVPGRTTEVTVDGRACAVVHGPGPPRGVPAPLAFSTVDRFCMVFLCGRAGGLAAKTGGFRPGQRASR